RHPGSNPGCIITGCDWESHRAAHNCPSVVRACQHLMMAKRDRPYVDKYKGRITSAGQKYGVDPAVLGGIISRESRGGTGLVNGSGDNGNAHGLMQVDKRYHSPKGAWDSQAHIDQGAQILAGSYSDVERKYPHWTKEKKLKGALAAYNMGAGSISSYEQVDAKTTGEDYSNDVVARAQYFKKHGY
uniref:Lysozyme g n=1 Tax=Salmo trutta TaxID=8032 RepID=A0A673WAG3_SALTR